MLFQLLTCSVHSTPSAHKRIAQLSHLHGTLQHRVAHRLKLPTLGREIPLTQSFDRLTLANTQWQAP
jgi:hypothetical protein